MKIIKHIRIENFRSLKNIDIQTTNINVFSGLNDTGKSNVLKALNLFFNEQTDFLLPLKFGNDFSKIALASAQRAGKKKQQIKIKIYFNIPKSFPSLTSESEVWIERVFDRQDDVVTTYSTDDIKKKAQITRLLNKIKYFYVPALKGPDVLKFLLGRIGEHQLVSSDQISKLNREVNDNLSDLKEILNISAISTKTSVGFPVLIRDFWERLTVNTQYDEFDDLQKKTKTTAKGKDDMLKDEFYQIPLELRGEGIKSKYIPPLLKWIQKKDSDLYIWGIDEPENSLEFKKAQEVADLYFNQYSLDTQLFLTSHSLAFIFSTDIKGDTSIFRCVKGEMGQTDIESLKNLFEDENRLQLADEIGALEIQKDFYKKWLEQDKELQTSRKLIEQYKVKNRPAIYVEGDGDKKIIEAAWLKLYPNKVRPFDVEQCGGAKYLLNFFKNPAFNPSEIAIALWDCDSEGYGCLQGLFDKENFEKVSSSEVKHKSRKIKGFVLPIPPSRSRYANYSCEKAQFQFLEIEHYFSDKILSDANVIEKEIDGKKILKGNKSSLIRKLQSFYKDDFSNFEVLFKKIKKFLKT